MSHEGARRVNEGEHDALKGKTMFTSPRFAKTEAKLHAKKIETQLRRRKAPIVEPLPLHNVATAMWIAVVAGLMSIAGLACFLVARMIDPTAQMFAGRTTPLSTLLFCGFITLVLSLALCLVAVAVLFGGMWCESHLREMKEGKYLARWTCTKDEWRAFVENEIIDLRSWPIATVIFGAFFGFMCGFKSLSAWPVQTPTSTVYSTAVGIFFGFLAAAWILGKIIQVVQHKSLNARRQTPEAAIMGLTGLYFNKQFHAYKMPNYWLHEFRFIQKGELHLFEFQFKQPAERGFNYIDVRIPIPAAKLAEAECVFWMIKRFTGAGE